MTEACIARGLTGALLLALGHPLATQAVCLFSNAGLAVVNWRDGQRGQAGLFQAYFFLAAWGVLSF